MKKVQTFIFNFKIICLLILICFLTKEYEAYPGVKTQNISIVEKGNLVIEGIPEIPQRIIERMEQYQKRALCLIEGLGSIWARLIDIYPLCGD